MSTTLHIKGSYSQKIEIGHLVLSHHTGDFDVTKDVGGQTWSQGYGPATFTLAVAGAKATLGVSGFGLSETILTVGVAEKGKPFKIELDPGNWVKGTVDVVAA